MTTIEVRVWVVNDYWGSRGRDRAGSQAKKRPRGKRVPRFFSWCVAVALWAGPFRRFRYVTDSYTQAILAGLYALREHGAGCLYRGGEKLLKTALNAVYGVRLFLGIRKPPPNRQRVKRKTAHMGRF